MKKNALRKYLRSARAKLSPSKQQFAALKLSQVLLASGFFKRGSRQAFYLSNDNEINPAPAIKLARQAGVKVYLPRVDTPGLSFNSFGFGCPLSKNKFGIPEANSNTCVPTGLDVIFLPLTGFDRYGNRLGMGGGYYDRCLCSIPATAAQPLLVGLAYSIQEVKSIETESWDIRLDAVATDKELIGF